MSAVPSLTPGGSVFSAAEIDARRSQLFDESHGFDPLGLRGAAYDMRIGGTAITPAGQRTELSDTSPQGAVLILEPGESAFLLTQERLTLPRDVAGNLTLKTRMATQGLLLLSGMLIDPGFHGHLHLCIANLGSRAVVLEAGKPILAVQFLALYGDTGTTHDLPQAALARQFEDDNTQIQRPLAFLGDLRKLRVEQNQLADRLSETAAQTQNVIALGFFLVGATILGIVLSVVLSIGSNRSLVRAVDRAVPNSLSGKALVTVSVLSAAWLVHSLAVLIRGHREPEQIHGETYYDREARARLHRNQRFELFISMLVLIPVAVLCVLVSTMVPSEVGRYLWPGLSPVIAAVWVRIVRARVLTPITAQQIQDLSRELQRLRT